MRPTLLWAAVATGHLLCMWSCIVPAMDAFWAICLALKVSADLNCNYETQSVRLIIGWQLTTSMPNADL